MPKVGTVDEISRTLVSGWAIDTDCPDRPVELVINLDGHTYGRTTADRQRPNVGEIMKSQVRPELHSALTGRYGFEFRFEPPLPVFREVTVDVLFSETRRLLARGRKTLGPPEPSKTALTPLLVTAFGRSGTTVLMRNLSRHKDIVVADRYPFEIKMLAYYAAAYRAMTSGADRERSTNPDTLGINPYSIGSNPYDRPGFYSLIADRHVLEDFFERVVPRGLVDLFSTFLGEYYRRLQLGQGKDCARYFAEKCRPEENARLAARVFCGGAREVFLVRDPRDMLCSARSFWKIRTPEAVRRIAKATTQLTVAHEKADESIATIKYEHLVTDTEGTMAKVYGFLCLSRDRETKHDGDNDDMFAHHGTSRSPSASIGRWRRELQQDEIRLCNKTFESFLEYFEYEMT
jgi:hypothetical protein